MLEESLDSDLRALARRLGKPLGALVREAIARLVEDHADVTGARLGFVGVGRSGHSDVAERHEELLFAEGIADKAESYGSRHSAKKSARPVAPSKRKSVKR